MSNVTQATPFLMNFVSPNVQAYNTRSMELTEIDDQKLVEGLRNSDQNAFSLIYEKYIDLIYLINKGWQDEVPREVREDIVHDTFMRIWESRRTLEIDSSLKGYLRTMCKNAQLNYLKSKKVHAKYMDYYLECFAKSETFEETEDRYEKWKKIIKENISELPQKCQQVFYLRESHTNKQIAAHLGITLGAVKNYITQINKHFRSKSAHLLEIATFLLGLYYTLKM